MEEKRYLEIYKAAEAYYIACGAEYFLKKRKLKPETVKEFGLGYSRGDLFENIRQLGITKDELVEASLYRNIQDAKDIFHDRAIIPIRNEAGDTVAFGGRIIGNYNPKYLNSPTTKYYKKSELFFGEWNVEWEDEMIICEGYMDLITMREHGIKNSMAVLGTALTEDQIDKLRLHGVKKIYLLFDTDDPGRLAVERSIALAAGFEIAVPTLLPCKDPDEFFQKYSKKDFERRLEDGEDVDHFMAKRGVRNLITVLMHKVC